MSAKKAKSPLYEAVRAESLEDVRRLLDAGSDPNEITDNYPAMALTRACNSDDKADLRLALVKLLLERGADPNLFPDGQDGPLHYATMFRLPEVVNVLLEAGADVKRHGGYGRTPIGYAAASGVVQSVESVLGAGADVNAGNDGGNNALFELIVAREPSVTIATMLIDAGVDLTARDKYKDTALAHAAHHGVNDVVELLLDHGCSIKQKGSFGKPPIIRALEQKKFDTVELLLARGANPRTKGMLPTATRLGAKELVVRLLKASKRKVDPEAMFQAARSGDAELVEKFLDAGVPVDARGYDETALLKAAYKGHADVVRLLIDRGADLEARDNRGNTAVLHAAYTGKVDVIRILVEAGAEVGMVTEYGMSRRVGAINYAESAVGLPNGPRRSARTGRPARCTTCEAMPSYDSSGAPGLKTTSPSIFDASNRPMGRRKRNASRFPRSTAFEMHGSAAPRSTRRSSFSEDGRVFVGSMRNVRYSSRAGRSSSMAAGAQTPVALAHPVPRCLRSQRPTAGPVGATATGAAASVPTRKRPQSAGSSVSEVDRASPAALTAGAGPPPARTTTQGRPRNRRRARRSPYAGG